MNGKTDGRMDGLTDGRTDGRMENRTPMSHSVKAGATIRTLNFKIFKDIHELPRKPGFPTTA